MLSETILGILRKGKTKAIQYADTGKAALQSISEARFDKDHIYPYLNYCDLTAGEKHEIRRKYGKVIPCISRGYDYFKALKAVDHFDVRYLPSCYYYPYFIRVLNPDRFKQLLCHKSMLGFIYKTDVLQPTTPLRSLAGVYFDAENRPISPAQAADIIANAGSPLLFKPSTDSSFGAGIRLYKENELSELSKAVSNQTFIRNSLIDFVLQVPVKQSPETARFNPSSLNCMRITTLNLNGKITTDSMTFKCGRPGAFVDNIGSGRRGVIVGVDTNGQLKPYGYYGNGEKCTAHNGIEFAGQRIEGFDKVVEAAIKLHGMIDFCHVIGWDMALDENNNAVLIEGNTNCPGISLEQMCSGPVFGDRIDEVLSYVADYQNIKRGG